jgi:hypothetical protein
LCNIGDTVSYEMKTDNECMFTCKFMTTFFIDQIL